MFYLAQGPAQSSQYTMKYAKGQLSKLFQRKIAIIL